MQRGRFIYLAALTGAVAIAGWSSRPVLAAPPAGFTVADIGDPGAAGATEAQADGKVVQTGSGGDIWGTSDQFQFAYQKLSGDGHITARLTAQDQGESSSDCCVKSGVMIRSSDTAGSPHVLLAQNTGEDRGVLWEYRAREDDESFGGRTLYAPRVFPVTLRLERRGNAIHGWISRDDGKTFQHIAYPVQLEGIGADALFGLATTSHDDGTISTSTFDTVSAGNTLLPDPVNVQLLPRNNSVVVTWDSSAGEGVTFNVYGRVAPKPAAGPPTGEEWVKVNDTPITGRSYLVEGLTNGTTYDFAVAAVVNGVEGGRQTPDEDSRTPAGREGEGIYGVVTPMAPLTIAGTEGWAVHNIGTRDPGRASVDAAGKITMEAGARDAWEGADGLSYLAIPIEGDFVATARIVSGPTEGAGTDGWTNSGLMARESLSPASRFAMVQVANNNPVQFKRRHQTGRRPENVDQTLPDSNDQRPVWVRLTRTGDQFKAEWSADTTADPAAVAWKPVDNDAGDGAENQTITGFSRAAYIGIQLNGRGEGSGQYSKLEVDNVSVVKK